MVVWKNNIDNSNVGYKAQNLDQIQGFNVPNFYAITREETEQLTQGSTNPREILNQKQLDQEKIGELEKAFKELGMSNEVRNSSGKARNLVSGQRNNVKASIRISEQPEQVFQKELNITRKNLEQKTKELLADYHQNKSEDAPKHPSIIIQKMIEPETTGALTLNYQGNTHLIETVPGLGTTMEKATTRPEIYLVNDDTINKRIPEIQTKAEKHPVNGSTRKKRIQKEEHSLEDSEIKKIVGKLENQSYNVKFVYKRGTFYIVDATEAKETNPFTDNQTHTTGIRASKGEIKGRIGQQIHVQETAEQLRENKPMILHKGSYVSDISQKARKQEVPLIVNHNQELTEGQNLNLGQNQSKIPQKTNSRNPQHRKPTENTKTENNTQTRPRRKQQEKKEEKTQKQQNKETRAVNASEILAINTQGGITLSPPHYNSKYAVSDTKTSAQKTIPTENYLTSYQEIFAKGKTSSTNTKVIDTRKLEPQGLENALKYIEAEEKILVLENINKDILYEAINQGFAKFATTQHKRKQLEQALQQTEKKYLIDGIRELKN